MWMIEPLEKKSISQVTTYVKTIDGVDYQLEEHFGYRWGHVIVENDPTEDYANHDVERQVFCVSDYVITDQEFDGDFYGDLIGLDALPQEEQELLDGEPYIEDHDWVYDSSEVYMDGPLKITKL